MDMAVTATKIEFEGLSSSGLRDGPVSPIFAVHFSVADSSQNRIELVFRVLDAADIGDALPKARKLLGEYGERLTEQAKRGDMGHTYDPPQSA